MSHVGSAATTGRAPGRRRPAVALVAALATGMVASACAGSPPAPLTAPSLGPPATVAAPRPCEAAGAARRPLTGFDEVTFRVTAADGTVTDGCALLAATADARGQGLMGQTDLGGYDAMVFRFEAPVSNPFFMFRTVLPLSLAWFDAAGRFVGSADMVPCEASTGSACPTYRPPAPFVTAVEVVQGGLPRLGIGDGATLSFPDGRARS